MKKIKILFITLLIVGCGKDDGESISAQEQFEIDVEVIDSFLEENDIQADIHPSGIRYVTSVSGGGISPSSTDNVTVKYKGLLLNGTVFDQSSSATFNLTGLIPAWQIMIPEMNVGGKITMYAPSGYCYGTRGSGSSIPPNTNLIFEVELLDVN